MLVGPTNLQAVLEFGVEAHPIKGAGQDIVPVAGLVKVGRGALEAAVIVIQGRTDLVVIAEGTVGEVMRGDPGRFTFRVPLTAPVGVLTDQFLLR